MLVISLIVVLSLLCSPNRGLLWSFFRHHRQRYTIREETLLCNLLLFSETGPDVFNAHDMKALDSIGQDGNRRVFERLREKGLVYTPQLGFWGLTKRGLARAQAIKKEYQGES